MAKGGFTLLEQHDTDEPHTGESCMEPHRIHSNRKARTSALVCAAVIFLVLSNSISLFYNYRAYKRDTPSVDYAIPPEIPVQYRQFWWNTEYSSVNQTSQNQLWDSILWTHGMVAMDRDWAKSQDWPESMPLPGNETKAIWLLEAYHEVHCLGVLRKIMYESLAGSSFADRPFTQAHVAHCFDYMLQVVMCNADSTPLYTFGTTYVGYGQPHKCRSWDALRDLATENSACYAEEGDTLEQHFGHCSGGDGLILGTPQRDQEE